MGSAEKDEAPKVGRRRGMDEPKSAEGVFGNSFFGSRDGNTLGSQGNNWGGGGSLLVTNPLGRSYVKLGTG